MDLDDHFGPCAARRKDCSVKGINLTANWTYDANLLTTCDACICAVTEEHAHVQHTRGAGQNWRQHLEMSMDIRGVRKIRNKSPYSYDFEIFSSRFIISTSSAHHLRNFLRKGSAAGIG